MKFTYYPGCSAHASAKEYDMSARAVFEKLGVELVEIDDWNCCGALEAENPLVSTALSIRNLAIAEESGLDLAIPCSACYFNAIKAVKYLREDESVQKKLLEADRSLGFNDTIAPRHLLDIVVNEVGVEEIAKHTTRPLSGIKVVPYYGCLIGRPSDIAFDDPDDPKSMDALIEALGAEQPPFAHKATCCGGALIMTNFDYSMEMSRKILEDAKESGAAPVGTVEQGAVAVIGGGVAGIISALDLVDSGFKVYLMDRGTSIGGKMSQLAECVAGIMPMMVELETNPDVELLTLSEVTSISGSQGNFELEVARNPRYVDELRCTGCAQCIEACPESIPDRFNFGLTNRKVIDFSHSQPVPNVPAIERDHCPPDCRKCVEVCTADAIKLEDKETKAKITVGSIILSPGYEPFDPSIWARYKLGNPSVVTSLEFERM
ncbi:hypothetical protein B6V01_004385, partial [Methanosarcinales archaeon ex4572_44]